MLTLDSIQKIARLEQQTGGFDPGSSQGSVLHDRRSAPASNAQTLALKNCGDFIHLATTPCANCATPSPNENAPHQK